MHAQAGVPWILDGGLLSSCERKADSGRSFVPGQPLVLATGYAPASYDCDCGLVLDHGPSYDCDCGLVLDRPASYDCDCGLVLERPASYDCDCGLILGATDRPAKQRASTTLARQKLPKPIALERGWHVYFNPAGPAGLATLNAEAQRVLAAFDSPLPPERAAERLGEMPPAVVGRTIDGLARIGLLRPLAEPLRPCLKPSTLSAWLHVIEACNLSCPYCYVQKRPHVMSVEVGHQAVDRLIESALGHGNRSLKLKYAGGEPTLNFPAVQAIHNHARRQAARVNLGLHGVLLTNGVVVSDAILDYLAQAELAMMISLDGEASAHDRLRTRQNGLGTYAAVVNTVERAMARGLRPTVSITLTAVNLEGVSGAVAFALDRDLPFNLNFHRECTVVGQSPSPLVPDLGRLIEAMRGIFDLILGYPAYPLPVTGILDRTRLDIPHEVPCSAGQDYLAIGTMGQISACQMLLEEPWASLADPDPLDKVRRRGKTVFGHVDGAPGCHDCQWRAACAGGCPLLRGTALHDSYCQAYQILLPELLRLEARRLITLRSARLPHIQ